MVCYKHSHRRCQSLTYNPAQTRLDFYSKTYIMQAIMKVTGTRVFFNTIDTIMKGTSSNPQ